MTDENIIDDEELCSLLSAKAQIYFEKDIAIHFVFKDGRWMNGIISECAVDFCFLNEFKKGSQLVFFKELKDIETYTKVGA
jgi:hypothetical protein